MNLMENTKLLKLTMLAAFVLLASALFFVTNSEPAVASHCAEKSSEYVQANFCDCVHASCGDGYCDCGDTLANCYSDCCSAVAGGWSEFSDCSSCTKTRTCTNPAPSCGGSACSGDSSRDCGLVNGGWSASWTTCSVSCGGGTQYKYCDNPAPACDGTDCDADNTLSQNCNTQSCCGNGVLNGAEQCDGSAGTPRSQACGSGNCAGTQTRGCNADCTWGGWSDCSSSGADCGTCCKCDAGGARTYDSVQSGDCSATTCTNACNAGGCGTYILGVFTDNSVANACNNIDTCTSYGCVGGTNNDNDASLESVACESDPDGDSYSASCGDCKYEIASIYPGASETACNAVDNDCDSIMDESYSGVGCGSGACAGGTTLCSTKNANCGSNGCSTSCGQITCSTGNADVGMCSKCTNPSEPPNGCTPNPVSGFDSSQDLLPYTAYLYDSYDCQPTACPANACGAGGCPATQMGQYPSTVPNTCEGEGLCTNNACDVTCNPGSDADKIYPGCGSLGTRDCDDTDATVYDGSCSINAIAWGDPRVLPKAGEPCPAVIAATPAVQDPPTNNLNNCICDESTLGGCDYGTCTRDTDGVVCDNEIRVCSVGQNPYCNVATGGDIWANTDTDKNCNTPCSGGDCLPKCTPPGCDTAFREECERCAGEAGPSPFVAETIYDYEPCSSGMTSCPNTAYTDFCSSPDMLVDYYCSPPPGNVDYISANVDCNIYDGSCIGTCFSNGGSGNDACKAADYRCSSGACTSTQIDLDTAAGWCAGCAAQGTKWAKTGETAVFGEYDTVLSDECCGDDAGEYPRPRECWTGSCADDPIDVVCCNAQTDCSYNGKCYSDIDLAVSQVGAVLQSFCSGKLSEKDCIGDSSLKETITNSPGEMCAWNPSATPKCSAKSTRGAVELGQFSGQLELLGKAELYAYSDIDNDQRFEVCDAASPGKWRDTGGTMTGYVRNMSTANCLGACTPADCSKGCPVSEAVIKVLGTTPPRTATSDVNGAYAFTGVFSGTYDLVAARTWYDASTRLDIFLADGATENVDFVLTQGLGDCDDDCTKVGSNVCDASCHGKGLCWYYSDETKALCDGTFGIIDVPEGIEIPPGTPAGGKYLDCCKGRPYEPVSAQVTVPAQNVVVTKKPVLYKGKFVNMVMVVYNK